MTKSRYLMLLPILLVAACSSTCPPESITQVSDIGSLSPAVQTADSASSSTPTLVEIKGNMLEVNRVIEGPLCNDTWSGTIYVSCDIQVAEWEEKPTFLESCDLNIEEGTVVYVAAHNDKKYSKGCSCHE
jgi:hypothetical protein